MKCVFTCSIFVDSSTKRFLSVLGVFGKYFVLQKLKISKIIFCPVLATQSRVSQVARHRRELTGQFWRLVCEWKVQSRGVHRDFRDSTHGSLTSKTSSHEKHRKFFQTFVLKCFGGWIWRLSGDLPQPRKTRVLHSKGSF